MSHEPIPAALIELGARLTSAWLANPNVHPTPESTAEFLAAICRSLVSAGKGAAPDEEAGRYPRAVSLRKSLASRDSVLSMIDGKPYRSLRRHLKLHGLSEAQYRVRYDLPADYPMVAPAYSEKRRAIAKHHGLGLATHAGRSTRRRST